MSQPARHFRPTPAQIRSGLPQGSNRGAHMGNHLQGGPILGHVVASQASIIPGQMKQLVSTSTSRITGRSIGVHSSFTSFRSFHHATSAPDPATILDFSHGSSPSLPHIAVAHIRRTLMEVRTVPVQ